MTPRQQHDLSEMGMWGMAIVLAIAVLVMIARMGG